MNGSQLRAAAGKGPAVGESEDISLENVVRSSHVIDGVVVEETAQSANLPMNQEMQHLKTKLDCQKHI